MTNKINRNALAQALVEGTPISHIVNRRTGKSTSAMLYAVAQSYDYPNEWIRINDPDITGAWRASNYAREVKHFLDHNQYEYIEIKVTVDCTSSAHDEAYVSIRNTFAEVLGV